MSVQQISLRAIAKLYGYDHTTAMKWRDRGMPMNNMNDAQQWVVLNVLMPLREENSDTDLDEQIKRERLKLLQIESEQKELEYQRVAGS